MKPATLTVLLVLLAAGHAFAGAVRMAGTDVLLDAPAGFAAGGGTRGLLSRDGSASITANVLRGGMKSFRLGLTDERLAAKGMSVRSRETPKVDGMEGILLLIAQRAGDTDYLKWMLVFGDDLECVLVVATFPRAEERTLRQALRDAVLSARRSVRRPTGPSEPESPELPESSESPESPETPAPPPDAGFRLSPEKPIVFAKVVGGEHLFTRGGVHPPRHPADPVVAVSKIAGPVAKEDRETRAKALIESFAGLAAVKVERAEAVKIDGLEGVEVVGRARAGEDGVILRVHLVALFAPDATWVIKARGLLNRDPPHLPDFAKTARSFRRQ